MATIRTNWTSIALAVKVMPDDEAGKFAKMLSAYIEGEGTPPDDNSTAYRFFGMVREQIDHERYISEVRAAAGAKGGAPKGNQNAAKSDENKQKTSKKQAKNKQKTSKNKQNFEGTQNAVNQTFTDEKNAAKTPQNLFSDVMDNNIDNISNNINSDNKDNDVSSKHIDTKKFIDFWNSTMDKHNAIVPRITSISAYRKTMLMARCREHGRQAIADVVVKVATSDFLNARSKYGFKANFNWVFLPTNFEKIKDGNYDNRDIAQQASSGYGTQTQPRYPVSKEGITLNSLMQVLSKNGQSTDNDNPEPNGADYVSTAYQDGIGR